MITAEQARAYEKLSVENASARASRDLPEEPTNLDKCVFESIEALAFASEGSRAAS